MNNLDNILKLVEAGYTKEEISSLLEIPAEENKEEVAEAPEVKEPETKSMLETEAFKELSGVINSLNDKISKLDKSIKSGNILTDSMHAGKTETAEDVLASLITPKLTK